MTPERYALLEKTTGEHITYEEIQQGWHWCNDFDLMLVGPGMPEYTLCTCSHQTLVKAKFKQNIMQPTKPVPKEILAQSIVKLSDALSELKQSGLNERAIIVLLRDQCPSIGKKEIKLILDSIQKLKSQYTTIK